MKTSKICFAALVMALFFVSCNKEHYMSSKSARRAL